MPGAQRPRNLPWSSLSGGSQTTHAMTRGLARVGSGNEAASSGSSSQKVLAAGLKTTMWPTSACSAREEAPGLTFAQAAQKAIELGGIYDGHEANPDVNRMTKASVAALAGEGLVASARDKYPHDGSTHSFCGELCRG